MAEFMTQDDADKRYGKKGRTNAGLTLGIIGTALAALNNGGGDGCCCGGNNGGGILGGLFGNRGVMVDVAVLYKKHNKLKLWQCFKDNKQITYLGLIE